MKDNGVYITGYDDWLETGEKLIVAVAESNLDLYMRFFIL